jgi:hypothetical protein
MMEEEQQVFLLSLPTEVFLQICTICIHYYQVDTNYNEYYRYKEFYLHRGFRDEVDSIEIPLYKYHQSYLTIKEWSNIDQALTNRKYRGQYLSMISGQQLFAPTPYLSTNSLRWLDRRRLKLLSFAITDHSIQELKSVSIDLSRLKILMIPTHSKESFFEMLSIINHCKQSLHVINFMKNQNVNISVLKNVCKKAKQLKFLSLNSCKYINNQSLPKLLQYGQSLIELNLSHCQLSNVGLEMMVQMMNRSSPSGKIYFACLRSIDLSYNRFSYGVLERFLRGLPNPLFELSINYLDFSYENPVINAAEITSFYRSFSSVPSVVRAFRHFSIAGNNLLTDDQLLHLLQNTPNLKRLVLTECSSLTNNSLSSIALYLRELVALDIRDCFALNDEGLMQVFRSCQLLRDLAIDGCYQMSKKILEEKELFQDREKRKIKLTCSQCAKIQA